MVKIYLINRVISIITLLFSSSLVTPGLSITSPQSGSVVEGIVEIRGSIPEEDFSSAKISYSYAQGKDENWFLITRLDKAVQDDVLATWDTTTITDGNYQLKLVVKTSTGNTYEVIVEDIQVANYSRAENLTTSIVNEPELLAPMTESTAVIAQGPTALPANKASINDDEIRFTIIAGIMIGCGLLVSLVLYASLQAYRRRR
jgi:hypothetical protein